MLERNTLATLLHGPAIMKNGRVPRFARPADQPAFEAWLLAQGYPAEEVPDIARMACCGLSGDDDLVIAKDGDDAWAAYQEEQHGLT